MGIPIQMARVSDMPHSHSTARPDLPNKARTIHRSGLSSLLGAVKRRGSERIPDTVLGSLLDPVVATTPIPKLRQRSAFTQAFSRLRLENTVHQTHEYRTLSMGSCHCLVSMDYEAKIHRDY